MVFRAGLFGQTVYLTQNNHLIMIARNTDLVGMLSVRVVSRLKLTTVTFSQVVIGAALVVPLGLLVLFLLIGGLDAALDLLAVVLPTAMGVVCALQALKQPKPEHHKRWFAIFLATGVLISATVWYQQRRAAARADSERQELQAQLNRLLFPLKDVQVSFDITVPLDSQAVQGYRERLNKCTEIINTTQQPHCGVTVASGVLNEPNASLRDVCISPGSELFPVEGLEDAAYLVTNYVSLDFALFKNPPTEPLKNPFNPDLFFVARRTLSWRENVGVNNSPYVRLCYDLQAKRLFLTGLNVPVDPDRWKASGKIISIPDLSNTTLIVNPQLGTPTAIVTGNRGSLTLDDAKNTELAEIGRAARLNWITLKVSNGFELKITSEQFRITDGPTRQRLYVVSVSQDVVR